MNRRFHFKESFYTFIGGIIASLASTILYEFINNIGDENIGLFVHIIEFISGLAMCFSCACILRFSSILGDIEEKYSLMLNSSNNIDKLWIRSLRAYVETQFNITNSMDKDAFIEENAKKTYFKLILLLISGCFTFILGLIMLIVSKVV